MDPKQNYLNLWKLFPICIMTVFLLTYLINLKKSVKKGFTGLLFPSINLILQAEGGSGWQWVT